MKDPGYACRLTLQDIFWLHTTSVDVFICTNSMLSSNCMCFCPTCSLFRTWILVSMVPSIRPPREHVQGIMFNWLYIIASCFDSTLGSDLHHAPIGEQIHLNATDPYECIFCSIRASHCSSRSPCFTPYCACISGTSPGRHSLPTSGHTSQDIEDAVGCH